MSKRNDLVFKGLHIISWIIFVGLCIEAGALLVNFIFSFFKPEVIQNLYQRLDLSQMYKISRWAFFGMYSFILIISVLKAYLFYVVIVLLSRLELSRPFSSFVASHIVKLSYITLAVGLVSYTGQQTARELLHHGIETGRLTEFWADSQAYILMAAVIYVIATIFSRGVELQNENDLTV